MESSSVSKRFFVTVPDSIGEALDRWAESERNKPATLAAFLLEQVIRQAIDQGKIPDPPKEPSYKTIAELASKNTDRLTEYGRLSPERLQAIKKGDRPNELEIARIALALGLDESYVETLAEK